jgi:hypothetical protein
MHGEQERIANSSFPTICGNCHQVAIPANNHKAWRRHWEKECQGEPDATPIIEEREDPWSHPIIEYGAERDQ